MRATTPGPMSVLFVTVWVWSRVWLSPATVLWLVVAVSPLPLQCPCAGFVGSWPGKGRLWLWGLRGLALLGSASLLVRGPHPAVVRGGSSAWLLVTDSTRVAGGAAVAVFGTI